MLCSDQDLRALLYGTGVRPAQKRLWDEDSQTGFLALLMVVIPPFWLLITGLIIKLTF